MRRFHRAAVIGLFAAALAITGCRTGGSSRSNFRSPPANPQVPAQPELNAPELGPPPAGDGPQLEGPAFPPSAEDKAAPKSGFDRKRYSQTPKADPRPDYAGTNPQPVQLEGPIARDSDAVKKRQTRFGYVELPPAP